MSLQQWPLSLNTVLACKFSTELSACKRFNTCKGPDACADVRGHLYTRALMHRHHAVRIWGANAARDMACSWAVERARCGCDDSTEPCRHIDVSPLATRQLLNIGAERRQAHDTHLVQTHVAGARTLVRCMLHWQVQTADRCATERACRLP